MSEKSEKSPLSKEVISHLKTIAARGPVLITDPQHGAIHGTSLEALTYMISSGTLRGASITTGSNNMVGDLSVYPTRQLAESISHITSPSIRYRLNEEPEEAWEYAIGYAKTIAQNHAFLTELALPFIDPEIKLNTLLLLDSYEVADEEAYEGFFDYFVQKGLRSEDITAAVEKAMTRKGFLVGISPEIARTEGISLLEGDPGAGDIRVRTKGKKGPSYVLTSGIQAMDPEGAEGEAFSRILNTL